MLTAEQRYRQAMRKARIIADRERRDFMAGRVDVLPCSGDRERAFVINEIERAFKAGIAEGRKGASA